MMSLVAQLSQYVKLAIGSHRMYEVIHKRKKICGIRNKKKFTSQVCLHISPITFNIQIKAWASKLSSSNYADSFS